MLTRLQETRLLSNVGSQMLYAYQVPVPGGGSVAEMRKTAVGVDPVLWLQPLTGYIIVGHYAQQCWGLLRTIPRCIKSTRCITFNDYVDVFIIKQLT